MALDSLDSLHKNRYFIGALRKPVNVATSLVFADITSMRRLRYGLQSCFRADGCDNLLMARVVWFVAAVVVLLHGSVRQSAFVSYARTTAPPGGKTNTTADGQRT